MPGPGIPPHSPVEEAAPAGTTLEFWQDKEVVRNFVPAVLFMAWEGKLSLGCPPFRLLTQA